MLDFFKLDFYEVLRWVLVNSVEMNWIITMIMMCCIARIVMIGKKVYVAIPLVSTVSAGQIRLMSVTIQKVIPTKI
jgi:hypothetical protein